jgi:hypothetical protein
VVSENGVTVPGPVETSPTRTGGLVDPIVVLGAARSGTTLLADTLALHPDVAYWPEPQFVWRTGNAYRGSDVLFERHATAAIRASIQERFDAYRASTGKSRFMEKTPSNCLRMPFVLSVLPEARVVHVLRDGRDVAMSAMLEWTGTGIPRRADGRRQPMSGLEKLRVVASEQVLSGRIPRGRVSWWELPAYAPRVANVVRRYLFRGSEAPWGPRIPGLKGVRRSFTLLETCAIQWDVSWRMARSGCLGLGEDRYLEIRYEDLSREPVAYFERILDFAGLSRASEVIDRAATVIEPQVARWKGKMDPADAVGLDALIGESLRELGYPLARQEMHAVPPGGEAT